MFHGYKQKIVETSTYLEIWEYEYPIVRKQKKESDKKTNRLDWLKTKKNTFDTLTAQGQYDSLKRKQLHYKQQRFIIARLIDTNFDSQTKFLTLTFKLNVQDITYTNDEFKKFIKRLNYHLYRTKKSRIKYLATWEKQKRGAIHYHIILFGFPYLPYAKLVSLWGHGTISINRIDVDSIENRGRYVSKYFDKELELKEHKKKAFFKSQNLKHPIETKRLTNQPFNTENYSVLFTNTYARKCPVFYQNWDEEKNPMKEVRFEEQHVRYIKIKKI